MERNETECKKCNGKEFVQGTDFVNLRPLNKKMSFGCEKIYTVCIKCGEIESIKIINPEELK
ncbi:hypothetical protein ACFSCX_12285 [Bacillus salitolerans]|uniref:Uncharacterized protein n=1 Tax=Bacillus salitolerans TaxID=1437434 RepID=A0ABW4LRL4_9BACI